MPSFIAYMQAVIATVLVVFLWERVTRLEARVKQLEVDDV